MQDSADYIKEEIDRGITDRESIDRSIKDKVKEEIAREAEAEFARAEREAIQRESDSFFEEEVSFKPEEIKPTEAERKHSLVRRMKKHFINYSYLDYVI